MFIFGWTIPLRAYVLYSFKSVTVCVYIYLTDLSAFPGLDGGDGTNLFQLLRAQLRGQTVDSLQ